MAAPEPGSRHLLLVNPVAGTETETVDIVAAVRAAVEGALEIRVTAGPGDARDFGEQAVSSGVDEIWVAGGDGTLREVALGVWAAGVERTPALSPIPLGTGNDLARSLGLPLKWSETVEALGSRSEVVELDVMEVELDGRRSVSLNAVVAGNGGRVGDVLDDEGKSRWGPLSYLRSAAEIAMELEPVDVSMRVDDGLIEALRVMNVVVANGRYAAGGVPIAPGARLHDGLLDLVVVGEASLTELLGMLPALAGEREPDSPAWRRRRISSVRLEVNGPDPIPVSVDGENSEASVISLSLADMRLRVRVPPRRIEAED